jgi:hypothetical protein
MAMSRKISGNRTAEDVLREYHRKLAENKNKVTAPKPKQIAPVKAANITNPEDYIVLPGRTHGNYSYLDLLVSNEKMHLGKSWYDAHKELQKNNEFMLTIRQFVDYLNLLKSGNAYDGAGNKVPKPELIKIYDGITEVKDPWRAEWLDAYFENRNNELYILTENKAKAEKLQPCLMEDKTPGINLEYWLKNATPQGFPPKNIPDGKLYFWHPREDAVAGFSAGSGRSYLDCGYGPQYSDSALGVRRAKKRV